jgi:HEAT repeat protein
MDIDDIKILLGSEDPQLRLRGLVALKDYDSETAVPLLTSLKQDQAFLVRSFVAMGLGRKRNEAAYTSLLQMLASETDNNVQAEIANSLGLYGSRSAECLTELFCTNENWLVRRSILAIMPELESPERLLNISLIALQDSDQTIVHSGISTLGLLADTAQAEPALKTLLPLMEDDNWRSRMALAYALKAFPQPQAREALIRLRSDPHHKVVAAALEGLLPSE